MLPILPVLKNFKDIGLYQECIFNDPLSTICMKFFLLMQTYLNSVEPFKSHAIVRCLLILFSAFHLQMVRTWWKNDRI